MSFAGAGHNPRPGRALGHSSGDVVRVGFVPLIDAGPIVAAYELGYFREEGLAVALEKQIGWGNVRDKLSFGHLQAAQALVGMPLWSVLGVERFVEPLVAVMSLGSGGNAITLSKKLTDLGVRSGRALGEWVGRLPAGRKPMLAHVFSCSMHHYLLREWLAGNGMEPGKDVWLCVLPPPQLAEQMARGAVEGMCVGEPWNTWAVRLGVGTVVAKTTEVLPKHPEKVLATSARFAKGNPRVLEGLVRAVIRGCDFCEAEGNRSKLAEMLGDERYLGLPGEVILESLKLRTSSEAVAFRSFARECTFPNATHVLWMLGQAVRWGHLPGHAGEVADPNEVARRCVESGAYRRAAASLGIQCPEGDFAPMAVRTGVWRAEKAVSEVGKG